MCAEPPAIVRLKIGCIAEFMKRICSWRSKRERRDFVAFEVFLRQDGDQNRWGLVAAYLRPIAIVTVKIGSGLQLFHMISG